MAENTKTYLREIMSQFTTDNVLDPDTFEVELLEFLSIEDGEMEGYFEKEMAVQRELSVKFAWGHNHDFGTFVMDGILKDRHIDILAAFIDQLGLPKALGGNTVLDIGVWCGGTTLLLSGMGAFVTALEEVKKYADCAKFLAEEFSHLVLPRVFHASVYDHNIQDHYDYVIFPGVLYHLTDPIVALRILFNSLKDGGELYLETAIDTEDHEGTLFYAGPSKTGNNWFIPTRTALIQMLKDVGFEGVMGASFTEGRYIMKAVRKEWKPMMKAGLSRKIR